MEVRDQVVLGIAKLCLDLRHQDRALVHAPSKDTGEERQRVRLDTHDHMLILIHPEFFESSISGPSTNWDLDKCRISAR